MGYGINISILFLLLWSCSSPAQEQYRIAFYNVENLFDIYDDPKTIDEEFTPQGEKHWTMARYNDKILKIAQVLSSIGGSRQPVIIGLAEIENRRVLDDLTGKTQLADGDYGIIHQDSPDRRGIDVAFLYRKAYFRPLKNNFFNIPFLEDSTLTRDILYVKGILGDSDTLHFFVCHFPSMSGGEAKSEWKRKRAASVLRGKIDSIMELNTCAGIVVMGDLNGKANTEAMTKVLKAKNPDKKIDVSDIYNTGYYLLKKGYGSYRYKEKWQTIDHFVVSGSLLNEKHTFQTGKTTVFSPSFLLEEEKKFFGFRPFPTYRGPVYSGGYSDHLPVYIDLY